jgi:hypothetical protein
MQVRELDTVSAGGFARAAFLDARMTSIVNSSHFSDAQKLLAERMRLALEMVYSARAVHLNYRKTQITLKVDQPTVRDRKMLKVLESDWNGLGVIKRVSAQGVNYAITRIYEK